MCLFYFSCENTITDSPDILDCNNVPNGSASLDDCGDCVAPEDFNGAQDCTGVCDGSSSFDNCGVCSGGSTGHTANSDLDCTTSWYKQWINHSGLVYFQNYTTRKGRIWTLNHENCQKMHFSMVSSI